jgi:hypothetical protein
MAYNTAVRAWTAAPKNCVGTCGTGKRFLLFHIIETGFGADAASYSMGTGQNGRDLKLTFHLHLQPRHE